MCICNVEHGDIMNFYKHHSPYSPEYSPDSKDGLNELLALQNSRDVPRSKFRFGKGCARQFQSLLYFDAFSRTCQVPRFSQRNCWLSPVTHHSYGKWVPKWPV